MGWLENISEVVSAVRDSNEQESPKLAAAWELSEIRKLVVFDSLATSSAKEFQSSSDCYYPGMPGCCEDTYYTKGPLTTTIWGQGVGYNNNAPHLNCANYVNGRAPTGCVATAMAQIMKYHQKPSYFNWSGMPNFISSLPTNNISSLMSAVGSNINMDYSCAGSSATMPTATTVLKNLYGYQNASLVTYDHNIVKQQLNSNRPVILSGGRNNNWWIFNNFADGHAWVCDGYRTRYDCTNGIGYLYLRMNWGWGTGNTGHFNGWYSFQNWNPDSYTFNYQPKMVINLY